MKVMAALLLSASLLGLCISRPYAQDAKLQIYVSADGSDYAEGNLQAPYRSIERVVRGVKSLKENGEYAASSGIEIILDSGEYYLPNGLELFSDLSGEPDRPIVFKSSEGAEAVINSAVTLYPETNADIDERIQAEVRDNIRCIDLSGYNFSAEEERFVLNERAASAKMIVYQGSTLMTSARYPNIADGKNQYISIAEKGLADEGFYVKYTASDEERIESWTNTEDIYIAGFPNETWEYSKVKIEEIDTENNYINVNSGVNSKSSLSSAKFWFSNIIEELDSPGEYFYDEANRKLYYYPTEPDMPVSISGFGESVVKMINASDITFENLIFEGGAGSFIVIYGGDNIGFESCTFRNIGKKAISMQNCTNSSVKNCDFYSIGEGGIGISGERFYLKPQNNLVENCSFSEVDKINPVYSPAVNISGVANTVRNCNAENAYHTAFVIMGNDNVIEGCKIQNVCNGTSDAGAVYAYCDGAARGNIIRNNYFTAIGKSKPTASTGYATYGTWSVYLDGFTSGYSVSGNVFDTVVGGVFVNNGGYNTVSGNIFNDVSKPVVAYGTSDADSNNYPAYAEAFKSVYYCKYYDPKTWNGRYPGLDQIQDVYYPSEYYTGNVVSKNKYYGPLCIYTNKVKADGINNICENNEAFSENYSADITAYGKQ